MSHAPLATRYLDARRQRRDMVSSDHGHPQRSDTVGNQILDLSEVDRR